MAAWFTCRKQKAICRATSTVSSTAVSAINAGLESQSAIWVLLCVMAKGQEKAVKSATSAVTSSTAQGG